MNHRKKIRVEINVSNYDIYCLEDALTCIPLCDKYKADLDPKEDMFMECRECRKVRNNWYNGGFRILNKLIDAYMEETYEE